MMSYKTTQSEKNLYLVGFMGVGKSHFGRLVAKELGFQFVDSDYEISKRKSDQSLRYSKNMVNPILGS